MNFFEHQDRARASTRKLVFLFACAIIALILVTTVLVLVVLNLSRQDGAPLAFDGSLFVSELFLGVGAGVMTIVAFGTFYRTLQLRGGGRVVAESLSGRLLNVQTQDADERKIINVVEEMAIAAGLPVPQVYLIEDAAINAFAAGYTQDDAVIGITRGCIRQLNREELQGVVAHEFSHIFNGDMRLNIRLMGWLYGIMVIGHVGYFMLRSRSYRLQSRGRNNQGGLVLLGLGLMIVGYSGTFFGNLIKAAVSRQREFLADASAVQFTRNPGGISGALKKIAASASGSFVATPKAAEISHMLFAQGLRSTFMGWFATHPPLEERIRRIEPRWDGSLPGEDTSAAKPEERRERAAGIGLGERAIATSVIVASVGQPTPEHIGIARDMLARIPAALREELRASYGAALVVHCMVLACSAEALLEKQVAYLQRNLKPESYGLLEKLHPQVKALPRDLYLPLVELALPSLRELSSTQLPIFMRDLHQLMMSDDKLDLFEWCLLQILRHALERHPVRKEATVDIDDCAQEASLLLSVMARAGQAKPEEAQAAYERAAEALQLRQARASWDESNDFTALEHALDTLRRLKPLQKPRLLKAMASSIQHDGKVTCEEGELLRAVAAVLDCPVPPLA